MRRSISNMRPWMLEDKLVNSDSWKQHANVMRLQTKKGRWLTPSQWHPPPSCSHHFSEHVRQKALDAVFIGSRSSGCHPSRNNELQLDCKASDKCLEQRSLFASKNLKPRYLPYPFSVDFVRWSTSVVCVQERSAQRFFEKNRLRISDYPECWNLDNT